MREDLKTAVLKKLEAAGTVIQELVVNKYYQDELDVRTQATVTIVQAIDKLDDELSKIKPKSSGFSTSGAAIEPTYSPQDFQKKQQLEAKVKKLDAVLTKALVEGDFEDLLKEAKNVAGKPEGTSSSEGK